MRPLAPVRVLAILAGGLILAAPATPLVPIPGGCGAGHAVAAAAPRVAPARAPRPGPPRPAAAGWDELVTAFERYLDEDRSAGERRQAVLTLADAPGLAATEVLVPMLEDEDWHVRRAVIEVLGGFASDEVTAWLVEHVLEDRKLAKREQVVAAVAEVLGRAGRPGATAPLLELLEHRELKVRLAALLGLGHLGDPAVVEPVAALTTGDEVAVVRGALDTLGRLGDGPGAEPAVLASLAHEDKLVRLAAVDAVRALRLKAGVRPLILMLGEDPDPRVAEDAYEVLQTITLRTFPDDQATWLTWWDRNEERYEMPDLEAVAAARERLAREGGRYTSGTSFQGIETKSDHVIFVIDVSHSMGGTFGDDVVAAPGAAEAGAPVPAARRRIDIVKRELIAAVDSLPDTASFNVVAFATQVDVWKKSPARANVLNRHSAAEWIERLEPRGEPSSGFRARMGLPTSDTNPGMTNTHLALMTAFGEEPPGKRRRSKELVTETRDPVDTIYFLTDGEPTIGETVNMSEIREEVRRLNAYRGVQLHVIYVGEYGGHDFRALAQENQGRFVAVGG